MKRYFEGIKVMDQWSSGEVVERCESRLINYLIHEVTMSVYQKGLGYHMEGLVAVNLKLGPSANETYFLVIIEVFRIFFFESLCPLD